MNLCYNGETGWHHEVLEDGTIGERVHIEESGEHRYAEEGEPSWHQRKHTQFVEVSFEDGRPPLRVNTDEFAAVRDFVAKMRGGE